MANKQAFILLRLWRFTAVRWCGLIGVAVSLMLFAFLWLEEREREIVRFETLSRDQVRLIRQAIDYSLRDIEMLRSLLQATPTISRQVFGEFSAPFLQTNSVLQALEWAPRVTAETRAAVEAHAQADGFQGYTITERQPQGGMVSAAQRDEYFPVTYAEPLVGNELALGFDLASNPVRKEALDRSRETTQPRATARITLLQETAAQYGFLIVNPVYQSHSNTLRGFALGVFRISDLINGALADTQGSLIDLTLYDGSGPEGRQLLAHFSGSTRAISHRDPVTRGALLAGSLHFREVVEVAGRQWSIICTPSSLYAAGPSTWLPWVLLAMSLALTTTLVAYLYVALSRSDEIQKLAQEALTSQTKLKQEIVEREQIQSDLVNSKIRLESVHKKLKNQNLQLVQQEKMASLGQMAAGVAHEINNPTGFVKSNLASLRRFVGEIGKLLAAYMRLESAGNPIERKQQLAEIAELKQQGNIDFIMEDIDALVEESIEGVERIQSIVQGLKSFARIDGSEAGVVDIHECLENTLKLIWNELKYKCELRKEYGDLPKIRGYPGQLSQVFMNFLVNAAHAIPERGEIGIRTFMRDGNIMIEIADTGVGISEHNLPRLFDPFFTTKDVGEGTGLGLAISHGIVQKHGGTISVDSQLGQGTTFTIRLPASEMAEC